MTPRPASCRWPHARTCAAWADRHLAAIAFTAGAALGLLLARAAREAYDFLDSIGCMPDEEDL